MTLTASILDATGEKKYKLLLCVRITSECIKDECILMCRKYTATSL